jgi:hypothetical protein
MKSEMIYSEMKSLKQEEKVEPKQKASMTISTQPLPAHLFGGFFVKVMFIVTE